MISKRQALYLLSLLLIAGVAVATYFVFQRLSIRSANSTVTICVEASWPGANAQMIADRVAAPIEEQVNGVHQMTHMWSRCNDDGTYLLSVSFRAGTDPKKARLDVQKQVLLAKPVLPDVVQSRGLSVTNKSPHLAIFVCLFSPDGQHDCKALGGFAREQIKESLLELPEVADVVIFGDRESEIGVFIDSDRRKELDLTTAQVIDALKQQRIELLYDQERVGQYLVNRDRPIESSEVENAIIKVDDMKGNIRLKDMARVIKFHKAVESKSWVDGRPAVSLGIYPVAGVSLKGMRAAVQSKISKSVAKLPPGVAWEIACDLTTNLENPKTSPDSEYLRIDLTLPDNTSNSQAASILDKCSKALIKTSDVSHVVVMTENPFEFPCDAPTAIVSFKPGTREKVADAIRPQLALALLDVEVHFCNPFGMKGVPIDSYPIRAMIENRGMLDDEKAHSFAVNLAEKLKASGKLIDVKVGSNLKPLRQIVISISRRFDEEGGIQIDEINRLVQSVTGGPTFVDKTFEWKIIAPISDDPTSVEKKLKQATARGAPLSKIARFQTTPGPSVGERFNLYRSVPIVANPNPGVSLEEARKLCETLAAAANSKEFRLEWMLPRLP